ncbi:monovalent cation/H(+) antiporter subunit G [Streptomyces sp. E-08]|uniref:monovalent cation/H(+) antiporter subunit G n=1 Tax=Streptomyces sp. E-08 TaxID=3404047 RepID=UPI003CEF285C
MVVLVLLWAGVAAVLLSAAALLRLRGTLTRLHALVPASCLGLPLIAVAVAVDQGAGRAAAKTLFIGLLFAAGGTVTTVAVGRAAGGAGETGGGAGDLTHARPRMPSPWGTPAQRGRHAPAEFLAGLAHEAPDHGHVPDERRRPAFPPPDGGAPGSQGASRVRRLSLQGDGSAAVSRATSPGQGGRSDQGRSVKAFAFAEALQEGRDRFRGRA